MNIYRGCEHQCIYCDSRSECYQIENFADVLVKVNAIDLLKEELPRKRKKGTICFGSMNDPYGPVELKYKLTRRALEVIEAHKFPIHMLTKSDNVLRDKTLIKKIAETYAAVSFTITTADDKLAAKIEPGAPVSSRRFAAMKELADAGIYVGLMFMPVLPFINDTAENVERMVKMAYEHGVKYILPWFGMTLRDRQRDYYYQKLEVLFPGVKQKYVQHCGGNYECNSPRIGQLSALCKKLCEESGIQQKMDFYTEAQGTLL